MQDHVPVAAAALQENVLKTEVIRAAMLETSEAVTTLEAQVQLAVSAAAQANSDLAEVRAENERLRAQVATFRSGRGASSSEYLQKTAPIREAANEMISAMGSRRTRRKPDLVLLAAAGFAEGSSTFNFDRVVALAGAAAEPAAPEAGAAAADELGPSEDNPGSTELATLMARVEVLRADSEGAPEPPPLPDVGMPSATAPTRLIDGQLLLLADGARTAESALLVAVVGDRAVRLVGSSDGPIAYDEVCSQQVLPWRPSADAGWEVALRRDVEALARPAADTLHALQQSRDTLITSDASLLRTALDALVGHADAAVGATERLSAMTALATRARASRAAIRDAARAFRVELPAAVEDWWDTTRKSEDETIFSLRTRRGPDGSIVSIPEEQLSAAEREQLQRLKQGLEPGRQLKLELQHMQQSLRTAIDGLEELLTPGALEALAVETLRSSGSVGLRRYVAGQPLHTSLGHVACPSHSTSLGATWQVRGRPAAHRACRRRLLARRGGGGSQRGGAPCAYRRRGHAGSAAVAPVESRAQDFARHGL